MSARTRTEATRCAVQARQRDDPLLATAAPAVLWFLVEQPGPWGRDALTQSRLDPHVGAAVTARVAAAGGRALCVRVHGRRADGPRRWAVADARRGREVIRWGTFGADAELLDVPLDGSAGSPSRAPVYLACTHGRHDRCCAEDGRPVALALSDARPEHSWECSHLGGDRFAGNVLVLPWGLCYGRLGPADVPALIDATERHRVLPHALRGRSSLSGPEQAAQQLVRGQTGASGIDDLAPLSVQPAGPSRWRVVLADGDDRLTTMVRSDPSLWTAELTCAADRPAPQRIWRLERVAHGPAAAAEILT